jgi:DNA-binding beta-propeller fold protein YncE
LLALVLALAACQGTPGTVPGATRGRLQRATPDASPTPPVTAAPSASPGVGPSPLTPTQPTASPSPQALPSLPPPQISLAKRLGERLLAIAQVGFAQARTSLTSDRTLLNTTVRRVGLIGNNAAGLVSNNGGGLLTDRSSGLVSNNGGSLVGDRPAGYRLLQLPATAAEVQLTPLAGEGLIADRRWLDGRRMLMFSKDGFNAAKGWRKVWFHGGDLPVREERFQPTAFWPNGRWKTVERLNTDFSRDGAITKRLPYLAEQTDAEVTLKTSLLPAPSSLVREPSTGVAVVFRRFDIDRVAQTGSFEYFYEHLEATETGSLVDVVGPASGAVTINYEDPLGTYNGESTLRDRTGAIVYQKRQRTEGGRKLRTYTMPDGLSAELERAGVGLWRGRALEEGKAVADLQLATRPNGSMVFTLTFPEAPDAPLELGYGILDEAADATPAFVKPPVLPTVATLAGATEPGFADGPGAQARFNEPFNLVPSRRDPRLFYLADAQNHRIRTLRLAPDGQVTVGTLVGTGEAGFVEGPLAQTRLRYPLGLTTAGGPEGGETLYLSEGEGVIRRITLQADGSGQSQFLAGTATFGGTDGPGHLASFNYPFGLAHDPVANRLYVVERDGHRVRAVDLSRADHPVSTLAGGTKGFADGPAASARFNQPMAIALDAGGLLYVADADNRRLRRLNPRAENPTVETVAGTGDPAHAFLDGPALTGGVNPPFALAFLPGGQLLFGYSVVRTYDPAAATLQTLAGHVEAGAEDGDVEQAKFKLIHGLTPGPDGLVLVLDDHRVRVVRPVPATGGASP